jgi:nitronate monooxygenase
VASRRRSSPRPSPRATETSTENSSLFDVGWPDAPHRTLRNSTFERWEAAGRPPPGQRPDEGDVVGRFADGTEVVRYASTSPKAEFDGDVEATSMWAGQSAGLVSEIRPAGEVVRELAEEAAAALRGSVGLIRD